MAKIADLVTQLGTGWTTVGAGVPVEETQTIPNPAAANPTADPAKTPSTITQGTGRYYVIVKDPEGHQRAMFLTASTDQGVTGPGLTPTPQISGKDAAPGTRVVAGNELVNLNWDPAGPVTDVPAGGREPSATAQLDKIDSRGNVIAPSDTTTKPTQLRDPKTGTTINLVTDPAGTLHDLGNDVILVKPDGSYTKVASKPDKPTQFNVPGVGLVDYDPSKPDGQRTSVLIKTPDKTAPTTEVRNGKTYVYDNESKTWIESNLPVDAQIGYTFNDPNSKWIIFYDKQGKEVGRNEKPDWKPEPKFQAGQGPAADLIAAKVPTINPQTGALEFIDNPNQVKASQAVSDLAAKLGVQVAAGSMSEKQAQDLITGAVNTMNAQSAATNAATAQAAQQATTANDVLTNVQNAAQTGAGVLQNRVTNAQGMLQGVLGLANGGQRSGNMGGGLMSAPAGLGENLVQGIQGWATELGGGPDVYTSAANLVKRADPQSALGQDAGAAYGALGQMLQKYRELTGQPHPAETIANQQQQNTGGVTTPVTAAAQPAGSGVAVPTTPVVSHGGVGPWAGGQTPAPGTTYYDPNYNPQTGGFTAPPQQPKVTVSIG